MRRFVVIAVVLAAAVLVAMTGCAGTSGQPTGGVTLAPTPPPEFAAGCGHPGTLVTVLAVPVVVHRAACDLTGVQLRYGLAEVTVPASGRAERQVETFAPTTAPIHILVVVADGTGDVTITG